MDYSVIPFNNFLVSISWQDDIVVLCGDGEVMLCYASVLLVLAA